MGAFNIFKVINRPYKIVVFCFLLTFFGLFVAWSSVRIWIKSEANKIATAAEIKYNEEKTTALLMLVFDPESSVHDKNMAVWTLGILKDKDALEELEELKTTPDKNEILGISDYELQKAILKIKGEYRNSRKLTQK